MIAIDLTERERFLLRGLAAGMTRKQIGRSLHLSISSIDTTAVLLFGKLGVRSAAHAVDRAWRLGLLVKEAA